jgi:hypothetical protein
MNKLILQLNTTAAPVLESNQKIEVVIAVISVLFVGIVAYMISVERRLKKIENNK